MYHRISSPECPIPQPAIDEKRFALPVEEFAWQMDSMVSLGYRGVSVGEIFDVFKEGRSVPQNWVVLTFDDGNRSDFVHALPHLADRGFSATFFVGAGRIGTESGLEEKMIEDLVAGGMEIGSHGLSHRFLSSLSAGEEMEECSKSKQILSEISGRETRFFALPGGRSKRRTIHALRQLGYSAVCTSQYGFNSSRQSFLLKRFPIHQGTARPTFHAILERSIPKLLPGYCKTTAVKIARTVIGERIYRKIRTASLRG
jgi:peptidoglycan/xylan/chitin deacetylase (PgdA/CDA1 family)